MAAALLAGAPLLWSACTDTWDEHYNVNAGGMADQPSLLQNISSDPSLANFLSVLKEIGGDEVLNSPQQYTVWAPKSLTAAQRDSIISVYNKDKAEGKKWEDNSAVIQFLQNHMALYARPVSAFSKDTVSMRNRKYMHVEGLSDKSGKIDGIPFGDMVLSNNGILYKIDNMLPFFANVREHVEHQANMDSLTSFFKKYDEYELDVEASTPGGVVDGKTVYLDSVTSLRNRIIDRYGYIQREDSTYTLIAPTDEVWKKEYERNLTYLNYIVDTKSDEDVKQKDSLLQIHARDFIMRGRFFNTSDKWYYNLNAQDSLCNTMYSDRQEHNPRKNVYYNPFSADGILNGLAKNKCSNGWVYTDDKGVIDPRTTFFGRQEFACQSSAIYEVPKDTKNDPTMNVTPLTYTVYKTDTIWNEDHTDYELEVDQNNFRNYYYLDVVNKTPSKQTEIDYKVTGTFSNAYYNIYIVTCPDRRTQLDSWFTVQQALLTNTGKYGKDSYFENPHRVVEGSCENSDVILSQSNNERFFVSSGTKMDTILVRVAEKYEYSGYGADNGINSSVVKFKISSAGPSSSSYREKVYTRTLRLNEIIMIPFETKEEAEAAADDLNAFNDKVLQALKEK